MWVYKQTADRLEEGLLWHEAILRGQGHFDEGHFTLNYIQSHLISLNMYDYYVKVEGIN
jgi:hypothetical protein